MDILKINQEAKSYSNDLAKTLAKENRELTMADIEKAVCFGTLIVLNEVQIEIIDKDYNH